MRSPRETQAWESESTMSDTYLDHNATTPPLPAVIDAMLDCLRGDWANPSSTHREGIAARRRIELARESIGRLIGCRPRDLLLGIFRFS